MAKKYNEIPAKDNMKITMDVDVEEEHIQKEKLTKLVQGDAKIRKKGLINRLVTSVVGPEGLPGIGTYVNEEIVLPAIKNIIVDAVTSGINMVMYGDSKPAGRSNSYSGRGRQAPYRPNTNYTSRYTNHQPEPVETRAPVRRGGHGVEEYLIEDRFDAAHVLSTLTENADRYDSVSVADYYDLIGVSSQYTDNTYGWTIDVIGQTNIVPVRGGYILKFPPVEVI